MKTEGTDVSEQQEPGWNAWHLPPVQPTTAQQPEPRVLQHTVTILVITNIKIKPAWLSSR